LDARGHGGGEVGADVGAVDVLSTKVVGDRPPLADDEAAHIDIANLIDVQRAVWSSRTEVSELNVPLAKHAALGGGLQIDVHDSDLVIEQDRVSGQVNLLVCAGLSAECGWPDDQRFGRGRVRRDQPQPAEGCLHRDEQVDRVLAPGRILDVASDPLFLHPCKPSHLPTAHAVPVSDIYHALSHAVDLLEQSRSDQFHDTHLRLI
jgi:hypothetical protein